MCKQVTQEELPFYSSAAAWPVSLRFVGYRSRCPEEPPGGHFPHCGCDVDLGVLFPWEVLVSWLDECLVSFVGGPGKLCDQKAAPWWRVGSRVGWTGLQCVLTLSREHTTSPASPLPAQRVGSRRVRLDRPYRQKQRASACCPCPSRGLFSKRCVLRSNW